MLNNQTTTALIHFFVIIVLMVTFSWMALADFSWLKTPDSLETLQTEQIPLDKLPMSLNYEIMVLKEAQRIESKYIGTGARQSEIYQSYKIIRSAQEAELIFSHLLNEKNVITKIYAMKGLQHLNSPLFSQIKPYFAQSHLSVQKIAGCIVSNKKVSTLIEDNWIWQ